MDARMRWMQVEWPTTTTMLELPICLTIMGAMALVATHSFVQLQQRLYVLEAVSIMTGPKTAMMEYHAMTGNWPVSNEQAGYSAESLMKEGRLRSVLIREGGAVDITFSRRAGDSVDKVLSIRAWQGPSPDLPAAWHCGRRASVTSLAAAAPDQTTLSDDEIPSPCRSHQ
jgi:Tfp pilus assembly protein PilE